MFRSNGQAGSSFQAVPARPAPCIAPCPGNNAGDARYKVLHRLDV